MEMTFNGTCIFTASGGSQPGSDLTAVVLAKTVPFADGIDGI